MMEKIAKGQIIEQARAVEVINETTKKMKTKTKLPKWFLNEDPVIYREGDEVQNPFSGECHTLNADELSMHDYLIGLQFTIEKNGGVFNPRTFPYHKDLARGLSWFKENNVEAFKVFFYTPYY